jgi:DNA-binding NarL/FixJ family response regulator
MGKTFYFYTDPQNTTWSQVLAEAVAPWGIVETLTAATLWERLQTALPAALLLDAGQCEDVAVTTEQLLQKFPALPVIVLTASPGWQLLRRVYQAGARDCVKMSLDPQRLRAELQQALALNLP